jgi:hypothetical protein
MEVHHACIVFFLKRANLDICSGVDLSKVYRGLRDLESLPVAVVIVEYASQIFTDDIGLVQSLALRDLAC